MKVRKIKNAGWLAGAPVGLALAAGGLLIRPAAYLLELLPQRYSRYLLGGDLVTLHSRVLGFYGGLALALVCASVLVYSHLCRQADFVFLRNGRGKALFVVLVVLALLTLSLSINRVFWDDEIEHIHASWYVQNGQVPYRDFFEHHHPLFWFLLAPVIACFGESLLVLAAARLLVLLMAAGIGWFTWRISRLAGGDAETACLAVIILFSNFLFLPSVIEIRPDVPMVLFALAAVERLLVFMGEAKPRQLLAAAFSAALAFLFLQKVIFIFPAATVLLFAWHRSGRVPAALLRQAVAVFLLPLFLFTAWLVFSGAFQDYFLCNWRLNMQRQNAFYLWLRIGAMALVNIVFWLSLLPALWRALLAKASSPALKVTAWLALTALAALFLLPNPADRHFLLALPLLSVIVGAWAGERPCLLLRGWAGRIYLAGLLLAPLPFLFVQGFPLNGRQLEKIAYVLRHSTADEKVFDDSSDFNLFRPDLHYFWFQTAPGEMLDAYRRLGAGRRGDYDACRLVGEQRPRFVLLKGREWGGCGSWSDYAPTPYPGVLIRATSAPPGAAGPGN
jgi:hypothetical protein